MARVEEEALPHDVLPGDCGSSTKGQKHHRSMPTETTGIFGNSHGRHMPGTWVASWALGLSSSMLP